jgi:hypothetical protein
MTSRLRSLLNPEESGFQPTAAPTAFQAVVVQFNLVRSRKTMLEGLPTGV